jgi:Tol biopolymer transport system component
MKALSGGVTVVLLAAACFCCRAQAQQREKGIWVAQWNGTAVVASSIRHVSPADGGVYLQPMMHPDGTKVVFWGRGPGVARRQTDVWVVNVDGTNLHRVTTDRKRNEGPAWTADGRIVWHTERGGDPGMRIWVMDADGSNARALTAGPPSRHDCRPCVSPDGKTVVFSSNLAGGNDQTLWKVPLAGGKPEQVLPNAGTQFRPVFSHDGKRLAFFTPNSPVKRFNLAVMNWPDGKPAQPVRLGPPNDNLRGPFWMRDNKRVLVHGKLRGSSATRIYLIEVDTGKWRVVDVRGFLSSGHGTLDRAEKRISFDGARLKP